MPTTPHTVTPDPAGSTNFDDLNVGELLSADAINKIKNNGVVQVKSFDDLAALPESIKVAHVGDIEPKESLKEALYFRGLLGEWTRANDYDTGWTLIDGQQFRRIGSIVYGQGIVITSDVADLEGTEFAPTHSISLSAHYDDDKTISNPVYNDGARLKINSQNGKPVVWSGSWSTGAERASATNVTDLTATPSDTSVVLTWSVK